MEGEGHAPKPPMPRGGEPVVKAERPVTATKKSAAYSDAHSEAHSHADSDQGDDIHTSFVSVDFEDVEDLPPSTEDVSDEIDVELDGDASVDKLLAMTGENWSIDAHRETLKEAGKDKDRESRLAPDAKPAVPIPTPFDFGADENTVRPPEPARPAAPGRSGPPPLPGQAPIGARASFPPPPPLPREREETGSLRPPPLPSNRPNLGLHEARVKSQPPVAPAAPPSRRPPPPPLVPRESTASFPSPRPSMQSLPAVATTGEGSALVELLTTRIERLETSEDKVGLARAYVELSIVHETLADDARVNAAAESALKVDPDMAPAHTILRRRLHSRTQLVPMLRHLERELAVVSSEAAAIELLATRARLLEAGDRADDAREAWELALGRAPHHAAALKGLEADLVERAFRDRAKSRGTADGSSDDDDAWEDLIAHLGRMSDAYAAQPDLAAWLHVERARLLEMQLGRVDAARGAFERALRLDPGTGPVRDAFTLHAAAHHDSARLAALLAEEARIEQNLSRCARLELDAACIAHTLLGDDVGAIALLERAAARAPTTPLVDRRVLDDLVRLYERAGQWHEAARSRRARLRFFNEAPALVYELRRLATVEERLGNLDRAITEVERAIGLDPEDTTHIDELDRLLAAANKDDERIALWHGEAQRVEEGSKRARSLAKAAQLAETLGRHEEALRHLRAAWVAAPGDSEILDQLSRLMSPAPTETFDRDVRALIELYSQGAQSTRDTGRRVAYLEKVALLWEETIGDPVRAARTYEEVLRLEPGRRGAILGLERTAGRVGDDRALSKALYEEAKLAEDGVDVLALRVRSAQVLSRVDAPRALSLVSEVLEVDGNHVAARALETRLHEEAGRWEQAAASIRARIELAVTSREKTALWLSLAHIQDVRLRSPKDAVASLQAARKVDPIHPVPPEEIARVLEAAGDAKALREAIEQLAHDAITPLERARHLARAGEIDELRLDDDAAAAAIYARALAETPEDELIADRLLRVLARRVVTTASRVGPAMVNTPAWNDLLKHVANRAEKSTTAAQASGFSFLLASLLVTGYGVSKTRTANDRSPPDGVLAQASRKLETLLDADPHHVGALRMLEAIGRRAGLRRDPLARILKLQGENFTDVRARLGAFWELASHEAWHLAAGESVATYTRILELDPTDPSGLEAAVRISLGPARRNDVSARRAAIAALRSLSALAQDEGARLATDARLGLHLEAHADEVADGDAAHMAAQEALERMRDLLTLDPLSVTGATSLARLANRLGDAAGAVAAAISLADLSVQPKVRAKYLVDAANLLLSDAPEDALGPMSEREDRAVTLLEKALEADPNSTVAASRLSEVRSSQNRAERLIDVFRAAIARASARDAVVLLGSEIARVARDEMGEIAVAIEAMRRVREAAPDHVPSLLTLSELFIAERAWPEALETLEDVVARGRETPPRVTALFALASVYEKVLSRPADSENALRRALEIDKDNPRAIRALIHRLAAKQNETAADGSLHSKAPIKLEIASLLERLTLVEPDRRVKCDILIELADIRFGLKDVAQTEKALIEAVAICPDHPRAFGRLARFYRTPGGGGAVDGVSYARALATVIGRGQQLGTQDARWYAALGRIEIEQLNRLRDGVTHLSRALQMNPALHQSRFELAAAYSRLGAHDEASKTVISMLSPNAAQLSGIENPSAALELLERSLNAERRGEEAIVVSELRAIAGDLDEGRHVWLRSRRLNPFDAHHAPLDRATLVSHVVPPEGRHLLLDIAAAIAGLESKLLRADILEIGVSSRERIGRRAGNPTRALLDRLAKAIGVNDVDLIVTPNVTRTRVIAQDNLWVLVPKALTELPEPTQLASLGRALARIALGVPWLEEIPPPHIEAMLVAAARAVNPAYGQDEVDVLSLKLVHQYEPNLVKELSRKHKQALERLMPLTSTPQGRLVPIDVFIGALARAELRIAYLLTGDVLATIDELRGLDAAFLQATETPGRSSLAAVLNHPFAGDVVRYALTPEATALRRRVGATWAG
ncbi:TPR domain protein, putative component of TonB system [Labilithrix luteola]|uniref:TPR domain protein, putative component of TonB system n=1 Tax=Labilithrix luteola TaxID=1391654 RepID=A0A0K1Q6Q8_9BACT|nr:tetratricopeptide repeat protein [Labilithrix luteola]AKV01095.1 TPR domain protein, putative component of TonB system [Labilithrix luteola]